MNEQWIEPVSGRSAFRFDHHAMNTVFGLWLVHPDQTYAQQASIAAFTELDRLEGQLSRFLPNSEISQINALKHYESVIVSEDTFKCLQDCMNLYQMTKGAFDISAGPLIDRWKNSASKVPAEQVEGIPSLHLKKQVGLPWLQLDETSYKVTMMTYGMVLDPGGYGKGYALDIMRAVLNEWGISEALLHGGNSSVLAVSEENDSSWPVSLRLPGDEAGFSQIIQLCNQSISGSGIRKGTHIVDPRSGVPAEGRLASWAIAPNAAHADALSTAFLIMDRSEIEILCRKDGKIGALVIEQGSDTIQPVIHTLGTWPAALSSG